MKRPSERSRRAAERATSAMFAPRADAEDAQPWRRPRIRAGIDEAGLGPILGPLTLGACALRVPEELDCPWKALASAVSADWRDDDEHERICVADSKVVFDRSERGERRLERTALAFLALRTHAPSSFEAARELLRSFPREVCPLEALEREFWSSALAFALPRRVERNELDDHVARLRSACESARIELLDACVRTLAVRTLNDSFDATDNKARTHWQETRALIEHLWRRHGEEGLELVVDRQGGRMRYAGVLAEAFPEARVRVIDETAPCSIYDVRESASESRPARSMRIVFREKAELSSFSVALASCLAKYVRETCMHAFNEWWKTHDPALKPTAGYVDDAHRWLADAAASIERARVDRRELVRSR